MAEATCDMALWYYRLTNHEVPLFFTNYILESVDTSVFNGKPPKPTNAHMINYDYLSSIKLKDLFHNDGSVKSKQGIEGLLGYSLSFNSYMNLRSTALQCPLHVKSSVKLHKSFIYFIKSLKSSKDVRATLYPTQMSVSNTAIHYSNKLNLMITSINLSVLDKIGRKCYLPERSKNFIFKFSRNRLKLSAQLSHFSNIDKNCTPCRNLLGIDSPETCVHLYFECDFYKNLFSKTLSFFFAEYTFSNNPTCLLTGDFTDENRTLNSMIILAASCIFYTFFTFAIRKKICSFLACKMAVGQIVKKCIAYDKQTGNFIMREMSANRLENLRIVLNRL